MTTGRHRIVRNCYRVGIRPVRQWPYKKSDRIARQGNSLNGAVDRNLALKMKKGLELTWPSIKIAGAQEGTRTPTELPAST